MAQLWVGVLLHASNNSYHCTPLSLSPDPGDYVAIISMELTFSATVESQTVPIPIADGGEVEGNETFSVTLTTSESAFPFNNAWVRITTGALLEPRGCCTAVQLSSNTVMVIGGAYGVSNTTDSVFIGAITV